jgi:hypothetical protein
MDTKQILIEQIIKLNDNMTAKELYWYSKDLQKLDLSELIRVIKFWSKNG